MEQIGRYRILDELGRGATGIVYRAQDPAIGRIIAIKTIRLSDFTDETERDRLRERLFREAQSAGILSHPNIVTIYDIAEENGLAYIFMEYVEGPPLERLLNGADPLDREGMLSIFQQTAIALDYAHKKGIVHRDIKPANILIHENHLAKITDFGVAKILSQQMTQNGAMMGTPNYMSPEQVQGHAVDGRADQFSLAVIAYEILTGEKPFVADHLPSLLFRIVREEPVPPQRLNPTLGPQVEMVLRRALAKHAAERYPSCAEFVEALTAACNLNPDWHPLRRSFAQTLPTIGGAAPIDLAPPQTPAPVPPPSTSEPVPVPVDIPVPREPRRDEGDGANPLMKGLVWVLVGIGLLALVLFGAQKFLFNRNAEPAPIPAEAQAQTPKSTESPSTKPSPVGHSASADTAQAAPTHDPPQSTNPETSRSKDNAANDTAHREIPPPVTPPKQGQEKTVQMLTDPPGAQVTVDDNSALSCKTPCMLSVPIGRHSLSVQLEGYRTFPRVFSVPQDGDVFLQLNKAVGSLSVTSTPPGAAIEINGEAQSKRTPTLFTLPPGTYHVKVSRGGAFLDFDVQLRDGEFLTRNVSF